MKFIALGLLVISTLLLSSCNEEKSANTLHFATSAEYPPFEYMEQGELKGFDIDLAKLIAKELGKEAVFDNMQFSSILPAVSFGQDDMAISTITITAERKTNLDFSAPYYFESMAVVFKKEQPITSAKELTNKKLACQLGTTMEIWAKKQVPTAELISMNNNNQAIEALKAGHVEAVIMDGAQGLVFSQKNPGLSYALIAKSEDGYGIALHKNSPLTLQVNQALKKLQASGAIQKLHKQWLGDTQWKN
ncbi:ABC transporter substrate-binding protein [Legionella maioricensis]|uniref:ABC transporter substrate-binding protein n=1 Tax=Legionella maioricensis TaxID=2896528 RepID=A0A9X2D123_9GAMM|nr:ABC transporter substrate-binding protein [Legionella maioricensis]MCL9684491.1 ABC transporter substrate-binding protein [Legionella maioricensis]MCL9687915.1 ABC transporter substrate-binding protein [Legionella maioricensis]